MTHPFLLLLSITLLAAAPSARGSAPADEAAGDASTGAEAEAGEELFVTLRIPLTSPLFADTPVAVVDEEPITIRDLTRPIATSHSGLGEGTTAVRKDYSELLERVINTQLIVQEARNIGLDELPEVASQVESMSTNLLINDLMSRHLAGVEADPEDVDALYRKLSREFLFTTVTFKAEVDATAFKERCNSGDDFDEVAASFTEAGRAGLEPNEGKYAKLKDLLSGVARAVYQMEPGDVSEVFAASGGFMVFRLDDSRFYEDPGVREEALQRVLEPEQRAAAVEYAKTLEKKYATVDERLLQSVDFETTKTGFLFFQQEKPVDLEALLADERVVATVHEDPPFRVTVGDLAASVKKAYFHGIETAMDRKKKLNRQKDIALRNMLFKRVMVLEARAQGLDRSESYENQVEDFTNSLLFNTFVAKAIVPDVVVSEDEVRRYYDEHRDDFAAPRMMRLNGLVFRERGEAEDALRKIRKGADFKWVSANSAGRVATGAEGEFDLDHALISATALPEGLRELTEATRDGDALLYSDPEGLHYLVVVEKVFPSTPQPLDEVAGSIGQTLAQEKTRVLIEDWSEKLREAYETKVFVTGLDD